MICELRLNTGPRSEAPRMLPGLYLYPVPPPTGHSSGQLAGFLARDKRILWPSNQKYVFPLTFVLCWSNFCPISRCWRQVTSLIPHQNPTSLLATHSLSELQTKVIRRFPKISQSRRRPLLGPSPCWKRLLAHLRHYAKQMLTHGK